MILRGSPVVAREVCPCLSPQTPVMLLLPLLGCLEDCLANAYRLIVQAPYFWLKAHQ